MGDERAETQLGGEGQRGVVLALARRLVVIDTLRTDLAQEKEDSRLGGPLVPLSGQSQRLLGDIESLVRLPGQRLRLAEVAHKDRLPGPTAPGSLLDRPPKEENPISRPPRHGLRIPQHCRGRGGPGGETVGAKILEAGLELRHGVEEVTAAQEDVAGIEAQHLEGAGVLKRLGNPEGVGDGCACRIEVPELRLGSGELTARIYRRVEGSPQPIAL